MRYSIEHLPEDSENEVIIRCSSIDESVQDLITFLKSPAKRILGRSGNRLHVLDPEEVFYIETSDNKVLIHTDQQLYESSKRLYELEQILSDYNCFRASKWMILNAEKIESVRPLFDGRLEALLKNNEMVNISRKYVSVLKEIIGLGGR